MQFSLRTSIFIAWGAFVAVTGYFVLRLVADEIKPAVRQTTEVALVDTANLLAEILAPTFENGTPSLSTLRDALSRYKTRDPGAEIWGVRKNEVSHQLYVTDAIGRVLLDSEGKHEGADFSRWNDVARTLNGAYGARSTRLPGDDEDATVMHVAAPINVNGRLVGVVTLAKPNLSLQPYIDRARGRLLIMSSALVALGLAFGGILAWRLGRSMGRLQHYAAAVSEGGRPQLPETRSVEVHALAAALESMRKQLDGKQVVEQYVQTLTHELKTPLAAIAGAAELLRQPMDEETRQRFLTNIDNEARRLHEMGERLLLLAQVEQQPELNAHDAISLNELVNEVCSSRRELAEQRNVLLTFDTTGKLRVFGDRLLLTSALTNLLDNALDFTPDGGNIQVISKETHRGIELSVHNSGERIPEWAMERVRERFYSLPRLRTGRKSTGLGLTFVQEVAALHRGRFEISNTEDGVCVRLWIPNPED